MVIEATDLVGQDIIDLRTPDCKAMALRDTTKQKAMALCDTTKQKAIALCDTTKQKAMALCDTTKQRHDCLITLSLT